MNDIPSVFLVRMQELLGEEYPAFLCSLDEPAVTGLRANTLKITPKALQERLPFDLKPLPWSAAGFWLESSSLKPDQPAPGKHPFHAAGIYYLQEPSAMAVAEALDPKPGERILDLCAAPGGKSTHLASLMDDQGLLVANEIHPGRVWELAENLERWGVRRAAILNESPRRLADHLGAFFDKVLVDAPCSGEGMFRRSEIARREWKPKLVQSCALRQSTILEEATRLVRPGGWLAYSTCTFNPQENEAVIAGVLDQRPSFELVEIKSFAGFSKGHPEWLSEGRGRPELSRSVRLWPHHAPGEGHFIALLYHKGHPESTKLPVIDTNPKPDPRHRRSVKLQQATPQILRPFDDFCQAIFLDDPFETQRRQGSYALTGTYLYWIPDNLPNLDKIRVIHPGWWLGTVKPPQQRGEWRFEPSHALAMGLKASQVRHAVHLQVSEPSLLAYLRGETLESEGEDGWVLVTVEGYSLGWGKRTKGKLKNGYPRGLRWS